MLNTILPRSAFRESLMRVLRRLGAIVVLSMLALPWASQAQDASPRGILLADLTWVEAERVLGPETIMVIPLGAGAKEHGPHLRLDNDLQMADYLTGRIRDAADVVIAPAISYHYYPSFLEYPGSTHLRFDTARDVVVDIVRSLANYGPRRFYILNTGVSTIWPLRAAADSLATSGILLQFTNVLEVAAAAEESVRQQVRGTHADEIETSMMLYLAPDRVDMSQAVKEDNPDRPGGLTRRPDGPGVYSRSGVWGDPTLATREKGRVVVEAMVAGILRDLEALRTAPLPATPRSTRLRSQSQPHHQAGVPALGAGQPDRRTEWHPR